MAMSGSFESRGYKHNKGTGTACFEFQWNAERTSTPGVTKVNWIIYRTGRTSSPYWFSNGYNIQIFGSDGANAKKTLNKAWTGESPTEESGSFKEGKNFSIDSGSFEIKHDSAGAASLTIKFNNIYIFSSTDLGSSSKTFSLDSNYPYSACTPPSTFTAYVANTQRGTIAPFEKTI